ncbi:MAG TPA: hypothetical protein PLP18_03285 [Smithellaceae bacterium]|nr:hypothetical protein [Smithellaceae bacterium]
MMKTLNNKKYLIFSGMSIGVLLLFVSAFNYVMDPYNLLGNNWTGVYFWNERQVKDAILTYPHEGLLLGSSKTGYVNPDGLACYRFYNASMRGMVPEEMYYYLKKYLRREKLTLIGFDFYMFNEREFPLVRIKSWDDLRYEKAEYILGGETVKASWKTLQKWRKKEKIFGMKPNGQFDYPGSLQAATAAESQKDEKQYRDIIKGLVQHHYYKFSFSQARIEDVCRIKTLMDGRGIPYAVFINPLNQDVLAALQKEEAYPLFLKWRREMKIIFPNIYDYSQSRYSARQGFFKEDPYHYTNVTGLTFLNEIISDFCPLRLQP